MRVKALRLRAVFLTCALSVLSFPPRARFYTRHCDPFLRPPSGRKDEGKSPASPRLCVKTLPSPGSPRARSPSHAPRASSPAPRTFLHSSLRPLRGRNKGSRSVAAIPLHLHPILPAQNRQHRVTVAKPLLPTRRYPKTSSSIRVKAIPNGTSLTPSTTASCSPP